MIFKNKKFIIEVNFNYKANIGEHMAQHHTGLNEIQLDMNHWFNYHKLFSGDALTKEFRKTIVHELTHWFDYNCSNSDSWSHSEGKLCEMLATFNELFHEDIEQFANMIMESKPVQKHLKEVDND